MAQHTFAGKLIIDACLTLKTGLHIGGSNDYAPIGAVDSVFVRDPLTKQPVVPGSSLKGKLRTLLAKARDPRGVLPEPAQDEKVVGRLFGVTGNNDAQPSRLQFADAFPTEQGLARFSRADTGTYLGEVKFENVINRGSGVATPRQIERVPAGMEFALRLIYNIEQEEELAEDMAVLAEGFRLLQLDYLGGHGSRGYGRVAFTDFEVRRVGLSLGEIQQEPSLAEKFNEAAL